MRRQPWLLLLVAACLLVLEACAPRASVYYDRDGRRDWDGRIVVD